VSWALAFLYMCFMCCCWSNISLGATIMECASEFVSSNFRIIALPIVAYIFSFLFLVYWVVTAVFVYSIGTPEFKNNSFIANIVWTDEIRYTMWFYLFALFWCVAFFICLQ